MAVIKRTKIINRARIMREIWVNREISRIDMARSLGLDKSTISNNVNELLEMGVIIESSEGTSGPQGGRKPVHIKLNKNFGCVLGLEIGPESFTAVAVDLEGEVLYSRFEKMHVNGACFLDRFGEIVDMLTAELERKELSLLGVGVGVSGVVNSNEGIIKYSIPLEITEDYRFYDEIGHRFDVPVFIDNDANACVWGELAFHRRKDLKDFIFLLLELREIDVDSVLRDRVGLGIGLVINGNVHYGHDFSAGEFRSIMRKGDSLGQFALNEAEQRDMEGAPQIREKFLHELGAHVGLLVNTFNLTHVILGGSFERYDQEVLRIFDEEIRKNWPYPYPYEVKKNIWLSSFGDQAVAYGAAGMVLNRLFSDIEIMEDQPGFRAHREGFRVF